MGWIDLNYQQYRSACPKKYIYRCKNPGLNPLSEIKSEKRSSMKILIALTKWFIEKNVLSYEHEQLFIMPVQYACTPNEAASSYSISAWLHCL